MTGGSLKTPLNDGISFIGWPFLSTSHIQQGYCTAHTTFLWCASLRNWPPSQRLKLILNDGLSNLETDQLVEGLGWPRAHKHDMVSWMNKNSKCLIYPYGLTWKPHPKLGANLKDTSQKLFGFKTYLGFNEIHKVQNQQVFFLSHSSLLTWPSIQGTSRSQVVTKRFTRRKPFSCSSGHLGSLFRWEKKTPSRIVANRVVEFAPIWVHQGQSFSPWYLCLIRPT